MLYNNIKNVIKYSNDKKPLALYYDFLGILYGDKGEINLAIQYLQKAISFGEKKLSVYEVLGNVLVQRGKENCSADDLKKAIEVYSIAVEKHKASDDQEKLYKIYFDLGAAQSMLAVFLRDESEANCLRNAAIKNLEHALRNEKIERDFEFKIYRSIGFLHYQLRHYDEAVKYFEETEKRAKFLSDEKWGEVKSDFYYDFACVLFDIAGQESLHKKNLERAIETFNLVLKDPDLQENCLKNCYEKLCCAYKLLGDFKEVINIYELMIKLSPENQKYCLELVELQLKLAEETQDGEKKCYYTRVCSKQ